MAENRVHQRILEIAVTATEATNVVQVTGVKFYRDRQSLEAGEGFVPSFTAGAAAANHETELGEVLPPPTLIRIVSTFV